MAISKDEIIEGISKMTVMELSELVKAIEEKFGVSAQMAAPQVVAAAGAGAAEAEEKTEFDVILKVVGDKKIQVIKVVRELMSLGLKEAKDVVDGAPKKVGEALPKEKAEEIKAKLEEVGATCEIA
ncbi:MAG: 50S ribosomal protein L7/L12 [Candidatus Omnitrophota bacterium]|nr:50S ribosomal protein L7/L12 [bacterium]MBU3930029.1 50S ribosomal protein L7/L12 [bacterium]MBU4123370.1 50S ribosomal protein L7/L12 [bacterium]